MSVTSHHLRGHAASVDGTGSRFLFKVTFSMLLTFATILLYALTVGFIVVAAVNDTSGGIADTFLGR